MGGGVVKPASFGGGKGQQVQKAEDIDSTPPEIHESVPVIFNGKEVARLNGTIKEYKVDIWSGAHPVWQGKKGKVMLDAGSCVKFQEKFGFATDVFGDTGMDQLQKNKELKEEMEKRKAEGLQSY